MHRFTWKDNGVKALGRGRSLELGGLSAGRHNVTVEVSDGNATVAGYVELTVRAPTETGRVVPGFGAALAILGLVLALLAPGHRRTR